MNGQHRAKTHVPTLQPYHNKPSCHLMGANTQTPTLARHLAQSQHLSGSLAACSNQRSCPCIILASLSVSYPDSCKRWLPAPQCVFNLEVQFENLLKLVRQGGAVDCLLYRTHAGRFDTTCASNGAQQRKPPRQARGVREGMEMASNV